MDANAKKEKLINPCTGEEVEPCRRCGDPCNHQDAITHEEWERRRASDFWWKHKRAQGIGGDDDFGPSDM